jgi:hypothetical protein
MLKRALLVTAALVAAVMVWSQVASALSSRNPFGVPDVVSPDGHDVMQLAERLRMPGGDDDRNAPQWSEAVTSGTRGSLDGTWYSRWDAGTSGTASIRVIGDRFYALYSNLSGRLAGKTWILEAVILPDNRLAGRWVQIGNSRDTGPFVGLIVSPERIDGIWSPRMTDRWDFRRRLPDSSAQN